jgi:two-component system, NarL family, sensor kinase
VHSPVRYLLPAPNHIIIISKFNLWLLLVALCFVSSLKTSGQNTAVVDSLEKVYNASSGKVKAAALYELVYSYLRIDNEKATHFKTLAESELKSADKSQRSFLFMALGIYHSRTGKLDSGLYYLHEAEHAAKINNNFNVLLKVYTALGNAYISSGKPGRALEVMFEGMRMVKKYPDLEMEMKLRTNIAWAYLELKQYRNCVDFGLENIGLMEGTSLEWIVLYTYNNIAISYGALGQLDSAEFYISKGIRASEKTGDAQSLANGYFILGTIYSNANKYDQAIKQYLKARPFREKVGNPFFIVSDLYTISELYFKTGDYKKGVEAGKEAVAMAEKYNLLLKFEGAYLSLAQNYEGLSDYRNATRYYRLWAMAKDTAYQNANAQAIAEMKTRFETEKKEQQLAVQKAQLGEQRAELQRTYIVIAALAFSLLLLVIIFALLRGRQRRLREVFLREAQIHATIQSQETERRRFAQDLHDGMGQLISALRLALHTVEKDTALEDRMMVVGKAEKLLNEMHQEIRSIAFNLMPQTLVQNGIVPALKEMCSRINGSGNVTVRLICFDLPERLSEVQEISLYRILQEWVNNVVKYANATLIEIQLLGYDEEINVIVEDDGQGFDVRTLDEGAGNGWKNIKSRINLMKASVDIDSQAGRKGTTLIIKVPIFKEVKGLLNTQ